jgi:hypothetical protein
VLGLFPGEGDLVRLEGHLLNSQQPVAQLIHAHQLALTITKPSTEDVSPEEDAAQIGFVIFDQLAKRGKVKVAAKRKTPASKAKAPKTKTAKTQATKTKAARR